MLHYLLHIKFILHSGRGCRTPKGRSSVIISTVTPVHFFYFLVMLLSVTLRFPFTFFLILGIFLFMLNESFLIPEPMTDWPPRLAFDLALGEELDTLVTRYDLTHSQLHSLLLTPAFQKEVDKHKLDISENGVSFRLKAKLQAEDYLRDLDAIVHDPETPPAVRLDAIKSAVKWAGYEPKEPAQTGTTASTRMVIQWASGDSFAIETGGQ